MYKIIEQANSNSSIIAILFSVVAGWIHRISYAYVDIGPFETRFSTTESFRIQGTIFAPHVARAFGFCNHGFCVAWFKFCLKFIFPTAPWSRMGVAIFLSIPYSPAPTRSQLAQYTRQFWPYFKHEQ